MREERGEEREAVQLAMSSSVSLSGIVSNTLSPPPSLDDDEEDELDEDRERDDRDEGDDDEDLEPSGTDKRGNVGLEVLFLTFSSFVADDTETDASCDDVGVDDDRVFLVLVVFLGSLVEEVDEAVVS